MPLPRRPRLSCNVSETNRLFAGARSRLRIDISDRLCRNPKTFCRGALMTDLSIRNIAWGLLASTALCGPAFAQDTTSDSPAPNTNATNVTG